eukprot:6369104-Prymnesium_polylepis.1
MHPLVIAATVCVCVCPCRKHARCTKRFRTAGWSSIAATTRWEMTRPPQASSPPRSSTTSTHSRRPTAAVAAD